MGIVGMILVAALYCLAGSWWNSIQIARQDGQSVQPKQYLWALTCFVVATWNMITVIGYYGGQCA